MSTTSTLSSLPRIHASKTRILTSLINFLTSVTYLLKNNAILVTLDVSSLYTNIQHNQGIDACRHFLDTRPNKHIPTETLCDLLRMILTMNNFTFNQQHYLQIHGTAVGTKMAPSFANLFLSSVRNQRSH